MGLGNVLDWVKAFNVLPGEQSRMEAQHQMDMDDIDRRSTANIKQNQAASATALEQSRLAEQQKWDSVQEALYKGNLASMPPDQAMQQANHELYQMQSSAPKRESAENRLASTKAEGAIPAAGTTALRQTTAAGVAAQTDEKGNLLKQGMDIRNDDLDKALNQVKLIEAEKGRRQANSLLPTAETDAISAQGATTAQNRQVMNKIMEQDKLMPQVIASGDKATIAGNTLAAQNATDQTGIDPALRAAATRVALQDTISKGTYSAMHPELGLLRGVDMMNLGFGMKNLGPGGMLGQPAPTTVTNGSTAPVNPGYGALPVRTNNIPRVRAILKP